MLNPADDPNVLTFGAIDHLKNFMGRHLFLTEQERAVLSKLCAPKINDDLGLTKMQKKLVTLIINRYGYKEIAETMNVSEKSARIYATRLANKLGLEKSAYNNRLKSLYEFFTAKEI